MSPERGKVHVDTACAEYFQRSRRPERASRLAARLGAFKQAARVHFHAPEPQRTRYERMNLAAALA